MCSLNCCIWWYTSHIHGHADEGSQWCFSMLHVWNPRVMSPWSARDNTLCSLESVISSSCPKGPLWQTCEEIQSIWPSFVHTQWAAFPGYWGRWCYYKCHHQQTLKTVWHQGHSSPLLHPFSLLSFLISIWLHAPYLGKMGEFKGLGQGNESYELSKAIWEGISSLMASSGSIILSTYGSWVPNIKKDPHICTANMWSFWTFYIGPILLWQWFNNVKYYKHFVLFVKLLTICLKFEITCEEIDLVCTGFVDWVAKYERYVLFVQVLWVCIMIIATLVVIWSTTLRRLGLEGLEGAVWMS